MPDMNDLKRKKTTDGRGGYRKDRPRPSAFLNGNTEHPAVKKSQRVVILSTGRGSVSLSCEEARTLAAELIAVAKEYTKGK